MCRWVLLDATQLEPKSTALMITVGAGTQVRVDRCALCARGERVISRHPAVLDSFLSHVEEMYSTVNICHQHLSEVVML